VRPIRQSSSRTTARLIARPKSASSTGSSEPSADMLGYWIRRSKDAFRDRPTPRPGTTFLWGRQEPTAGTAASHWRGKIPIFIGPEAAKYQMQVMDVEDRPR